MTAINLDGIFNRMTREQKALERQKEACLKDRIKDLTAEAQKLVGKTLSITEPVTPKGKRGKLQYRVTKIGRVYRELCFDPAIDISDTVVVEYTAELVAKPKNYRGPNDRIVGKTYRKSISLHRLNAVKVLA